MTAKVIPFPQPKPERHPTKARVISSAEYNPYDPYDPRDCIFCLGTGMVTRATGEQEPCRACGVDSN